MKQNVLVTCGGKWVGMVLQLKQAMMNVSALRNGRIFVADRAALTPAGCYAHGSFVVPPINDPDYVDCLVGLCATQGIRVVVPLIDLDLERLAPHHAAFDRVGATVVCPPPELVELCLDKVLFYRFAKESGIPVPRRYVDVEHSDAEYPLFYKRRRGFGSAGSGKCQSLAEVQNETRLDPNLVFEELLIAPEVSVDAFISSSGKCTVRVPRLRDKVVGGEAIQTHTIPDGIVSEVSSRTIQALSDRGLRGPLNVQIFMTAPPKVIEVNTRLGSASVLSNQATHGLLFRSVLGHACGEEFDGDPSAYDVGLSLYRYLGDVMHVGGKSTAMFPPG